MKLLTSAAVAASVAVVLLSSGCASVTGGAAQSVSIHTRDQAGKEVAGASCELTNNKGRWVVTTPGSATIIRSNDDMQVLCNKAGHETGRGSVVSATKAAMFGNIILGGGVGAFIDHSSGAAYEYPSYIRILMGGTVRIEPDANTQSAEEVQAAFAAASGSASAQAAAPAATPTASAEERLRELKRLHDAGLITKDVYLEQQRKIFESAPAAPAPAPQQVAAIAPQERPAQAEDAAQPRVGHMWKYSVRDQKYRSEHRFTARVTAMNGSTVDELISFEGKPGFAAVSDTRQFRFATRALDDRHIVELSPYFMVGHASATPQILDLPADYPVGVAGGKFSLRLEGVTHEDIGLRFGNFKTVRIDISGERSGRDSGAMMGALWNPHYVSRFRYTAWYAPRLARYVKARHQQWNPNGLLTGDEVVELLEHRSE